MSIRAVIFDVYQTLLALGPPPADAAERWEFLWEDYFADPARLTLEEFEAEGKKIIAREHTVAHARGVRFPEVNWTAVAKEVLPELARISDAKADDFLFAHAQLQRPVQMPAAAVATLHILRDASVSLGVASNSQAYTWRELDLALEKHGLDRAIFDPELCFWSFEHGFSKPDPEVFRWLAARLLKRGITPAETLMVGDREDNDIESARNAGWQTWRLTDKGTEKNTGDWRQLREFLRARAGLK